MKSKIFLFFFLAVTLIACKKDYPEDIPQWVKQRIKEQKNYNTGCITISEYSKGDSIVYKLFVRLFESDWDLYDYSGNYICAYSMGGTTCKFNIYNHLTFRRAIWSDNPDKCK